MISTPPSGPPAAVKSGYVWINGASGHFYGTPFGGYRTAGIGAQTASV